jgi:hypothetical protein
LATCKTKSTVDRTPAKPAATTRDSNSTRSNPQRALTLNLPSLSSKGTNNSHPPNSRSNCSCNSSSAFSSSSLASSRPRDQEARGQARRQSLSGTNNQISSPTVQHPKTQTRCRRHWPRPSRQFSNNFRCSQEKGSVVQLATRAVVVTVRRANRAWLLEHLLTSNTTAIRRAQ